MWRSSGQLGYPGPAWAALPRNDGLGLVGHDLRSLVDYDLWDLWLGPAARLLGAFRRAAAARIRESDP